MSSYRKIYVIPERTCNSNLYTYIYSYTCNYLGGGNDDNRRHLTRRASPPRWLIFILTPQGARARIFPVRRDNDYLSPIFITFKIILSRFFNSLICKCVERFTRRRTCTYGIYTCACIGPWDLLSCERSRVRIVRVASAWSGAKQRGRR